MFTTRYQLDKLLITAMDRFVWFVLLVVTTHLVTELTKATPDGYSKSSTTHQDAIITNDLIINSTYKTDDSKEDISWPDGWTVVPGLNKQQQQQKQQRHYFRLQQQQPQQPQQQPHHNHLNILEQKEK